MKSFDAVIKQKAILLFDGAMGTELYKRGIFINRCFEEANLTDQQLVMKVHEDYINAGSDLITTNTWGANSFKLGRYNLQDKIDKINKAAVELANKSAQGSVYIAGSIGPLGVRIEPFGPTSFSEAREAFSQQARVLVESGVDLITLETFTDVSELQQAILGVRDITATLPVIAHVLITTEGHSLYGTPVELLFNKLNKWDVDVVGLNCAVGPQSMLTCLSKIREIVKKPLCFQPNSGLPKSVDGRQIYMATPEYLAEYAKKFLEAGVSIVGGCCGTTPEHIKVMANNIRHANSMQTSLYKETTVEKKEKICVQSDELKVKCVPFAKKSSWSNKIAEGKKVSSIELLPPTGIDPSKILEQSLLIKQADVDAINIPDGPRASARMSAMLTSVLIEQHVGIETVLHYTCRDRNLLGMQSDILGAHAIGLRNLLLVTGDPPKIGSYPDSTGVFDVDAIGLTNMVNSLNKGVDLGGRLIGDPAAISIGVGVNPEHHDFEHEMKRFAWKVKAGAEWAITQPVFNLEALYKFLNYIEKNSFDIPIVAGIWPLASYRNAVFMNNEVPGVNIPDAIIEKMASAKTAEDGRNIGVDIAGDMVSRVSNKVSGIQVSAPFGKVDLALKVLSANS